jgi:hypothetical protein
MPQDPVFSKLSEDENLLYKKDRGILFFLSFSIARNFNMLFEPRQFKLNKKQTKNDEDEDSNEQRMIA